MEFRINDSLSCLVRLNGEVTATVFLKDEYLLNKEHLIAYLESMCYGVIEHDEAITIVFGNFSFVFDYSVRENSSLVFKLIKGEILNLFKIYSPGYIICSFNENRLVNFSFGDYDCELSEIKSNLIEKLELIKDKKIKLLENTASGKEIKAFKYACNKLGIEYVIK